MALIAPGIHMTSDPETFVPVNPGDVIAEKYRVERVLGRGGMGVVVAATHLHLDQQVALKFIIPGAVGHDTLAVERFMREARAAGRLKSEHVAKVYDVGMLTAGAPYIVMEFLEGQDLSSVIEHDGAQDPEVAADYLMQACEAMAEAHSLGIVHRDLKPQNLFLTRGVGGRPLIKVLDFGVSKVRTPGGVDKALTSTASIMGSPMYMAPEQMRSARSADARSDIWALGVVLYALLTGDAPFEAETMTELALKVVQDPHPPVIVKQPHVPQGLAAVVDRCLEKDPARRFPDVSDLAIALSEFAPPASRVLAEHTRAILKRNTDRPPGVTSGSLERRPSRAGSSPSSPGGRVSGNPSSPGAQALPERTIVSSGSPMGSTSAGWAQAPGSSRAKGVVGGVAIAAFAVGALFVVVRGKHSSDATPAQVVSTPTPIAADPLSPPPAPPSPPVPAPSVAVATAALIPAAAVVPVTPLDAGAPGPIANANAAKPGKPTPPPPAPSAKRPAPASHDDDIPALR